jgi:hypothetical protein
MDAEKILKMQEMIDRMTPRLEKLMYRSASKYGTEATVTVISNLATTMIAYCLLAIDKSGHDVDEFMDLIHSEVGRKFELITTIADTNIAIGKARVSSAAYTCQPRKQ